MSKTSEHLSQEPEFIYVVVWDGRHRIYTSEGQALNWFTKKNDEGLSSKLIRYCKDEQLGG